MLCSRTVLLRPGVRRSVSVCAACIAFQKGEVMPSLPMPGMRRYTSTTWITGTSGAAQRSSAAFAFLITRFASSGFAGIVATSMSRWPRCMSMVIDRRFGGFSSSCLYRPRSGWTVDDFDGHASALLLPTDCREQGVWFLLVFKIPMTCARRAASSDAAC